MKTIARLVLAIICAAVVTLLVGLLLHWLSSLNAFTWWLILLVTMFSVLVGGCYNAIKSIW